MIKLVVFDLDGVLVEARDFHYEAFNRALALVGEEYVISREEHLAKFDGLNTRKKLAKLTKERGLPIDKYDYIWEQKPDATHHIISEKIHSSDHVKIASVLRRLKAEGYTVYCASNSIRSSVKLMLVKAGYIEWIDEYFSNQDVSFPKPHPEIYMKSMIHAGVRPKDTLIVEDSHIGRKAVHKSGAHLCAVRNVDDVTYKKIKNTVKKKEE